MGIGQKIKEYRLKQNLTQKDLADKLSVTYQAVSRWENDEVEPSFETLNQMATLFNCTLDELFGRQTAKPVVQEEIANNPVSAAPVRQMLALCECCNKPIYESNLIRRFDEKVSIGHGIAHDTESRSRVYCDACYKKKLAKETEERKKEEQARLEGFKKRRIHSFIWSSLVAAFFVFLGVICLVDGVMDAAIFYFVIAVMAFTFTSCMILFNTFIPEMWLSICGWGIKLPGVIFTLDLDGILFLIFVKLLGALLSLLVSIASFIFATLLSMVLSVFVYPFALGRNIKGIDVDLD